MYMEETYMHRYFNMHVPEAEFEQSQFASLQLIDSELIIVITENKKSNARRNAAIF